MRILVIQTAFVGDLFLCIPLLKRLRHIFPSSKITLVCRKNLGEPFRQFALADEVLEVNKRDRVTGQDSLNYLRTLEFDYIISPHESFRTAFWVKSLKANKAKIGFSHWWNAAFYNKRIKKPYYLPDALRQMSLLTTLDPQFAKEWAYIESRQDLRNPKDNKTYEKFPQTMIPEWARMQIDDFERLAQNIRLDEKIKQAAQGAVLVAPGSVWPTKRWTAEGFQELLKKFIDQKEKVILIGTSDERPLANQLQKNNPAVLNLVGETSLVQTLKLMSYAKILITNDSGAQHMAAAADLPIVSIFGPTVLSQGFRPWLEKSIVVQKELSCRPCGRHGHTSCPIKTHACMKQISATEILSAYNLLLTPQKDRGH